jgi:copper transport protein
MMQRALAVGILLAGLSGMMMERSAGAVSDDSFFTHLHTEKAMANVTVSPARVGPVELTIQLETVEELPLTAKAVSVTLTDMQSGRALQRVVAARQDDAQWLAKVSVPTAGRWMLALGIAITESDKVDIEAPIVIK